MSDERKIADNFGVSREDAKALDWSEEMIRKVFGSPSEEKVRTLEEVKEVFHKWLYIEQGEDMVIDVVLASVVANRFDGDPVWLFLIAPPGGMKTEVLRALTDYREIYTLSRLTPQTLISGLKVKEGQPDPSLLPRLNGKVLVIKDFTAILGLRRESRQEIFSQLRDAYDGEASDGFGSGVVTKRYKSKFGLLAGVTPAIDRYYSVNQDLGERFLKLRLTSTKPGERVERAARNRGKLAKLIRPKLKKAMHSFLDACTLDEEMTIEIPEERLKTVIDLSNLLATLRSSVSRSGPRNMDIDYIPVPEIGTRLVGQFTKVGSALAGIRRKSQLGDQELNLLRRIARDTLPSKRIPLLEALHHLKGEFIPTQEIGDVSDLPTETCDMALQDLRLLKVVDRVGTGRFKWQMTDSIYRLMEATGLLF